jgi:UDP:flavonoid glycosyltransferase YjiC (YdhE family)
VRALFACTRGAGHFNPLVPFIEACRRGGHEVLVAGPPPLAEVVERAGYPFRAGAAPPEDELGRLWARVPTLAREEAEQIVVGTIFATLNVRAMLPGLRDAVREWRPDVIVREPAEYASAIVAEEAGVRHVQVAIGLVAAHQEMERLATEALESWRAGLTERIAATPYLTLFPAALEDPEVSGPPAVHRYRDPAADAPARPLPDWWDGDERPLVYVSFGSVAAAVPTAAPIYGVALAALADLPARVLVTTGPAGEALGLTAPAPHVRVASWVPQADVLPHASAVVCHGGSGTTLGALAAGVPLVVTPLFADQPLNGARVAAVGAGRLVAPRDAGSISSAVDPADLRAAVGAVLDDGAYAAAAGRIAAEIRELPPVEAALAVLGA